MLERWRTTHGFGVHSPWAYYFITEVLFQKYDYYYYAELEKYKGEPEVSMEQLKRVYRIVLSLAPKQIKWLNEPDEIIYKTIDKAMAGSLHKKSESMVILTEKGYDSPLPEALSYVILGKGNEKMISELGERLDRYGYGMMFYGGKMLVVNADPKLPRCNYHVNI